MTSDQNCRCTSSLYNFIRKIVLTLSALVLSIQCAHYNVGPINPLLLLMTFPDNQCILVTVASTKVASDLTNFPLLVSVSSNSMLSSLAASDGSDIYFTDATGTQLDHQVEYYDGTTGQLIAWVRVPLLSASLDNSIYLRYGEGSTPATVQSSNVWDANYLGVWHLNQSTGGSNAILDSTSTGFHGTDQNGITLGATGKIGAAIELDGNNDYIDLGNANVHKGRSPFTFSAWVKAYTAPGSNDDYGIWDRRTATDPDSFGFLLGDWATADDTRTKISSNTGGSWNNHLGSTQNTLNVWTYLAASYDGTNVTFYRNGATDGSVAYTQPNDANNLSQAIGSVGDGARGFFDGQIDELRLSGVARSADWISTSYSNQSDPASFGTLTQCQTGLLQ